MPGFRGSYPPPTTYAPQILLDCTLSLARLQGRMSDFTGWDRDSHARACCRHLDDMSPATRTLHESLIRAVKMMLAAWERWLKDHQA